MPSKSTTTKRNPQDTTLRNTRAANKRIQQLEHDVAVLRGQMAAVLDVFRGKLGVRITKSSIT